MSCITPYRCVKFSLQKCQDFLRLRPLSSDKDIDKQVSLLHLHVACLEKKAIIVGDVKLFFFLHVHIHVHPNSQC